MIRRYYHWTILSGEKCTAPSGSESEAGGNTVVFDFVILI